MLGVVGGKGRREKDERAQGYFLTGFQPTERAVITAYCSSV